MKTKYEKETLEWQGEFQDQTLGQMRHIINTLCDEFGESAILRYDRGWEFPEYWIDVEKKETPEEIAAREAKELVKAQKKQEADRAKFEKLKGEYGW